MASADGFSVPSKFVQLLLSNAPGFRELFDSVASSKMPASVKEDVLSKAVLKGLGEAKALLQSYLRGFSDGAPRFLRDRGNVPVVHLTDGRLCFPFYAMHDLEELIEELPINVYCEPEKMLFTLDRKRFLKASAEVAEFFNFVKALYEVAGHVSSCSYERCFEACFSDKSFAYELLARLKTAALHRKEREELYDRLVKEGVVECRSGFLVYYSGDVYYVTEDGNVFRLKYRRTGLMEAVLKIARGGGA